MFTGKSLNLFTLSFFCGLTYIFFLNSVHFFVKMEANSNIEQQKCEGHEKRARLEGSKM